MSKKTILNCLLALSLLNLLSCSRDSSDEPASTEKVLTDADYFTAAAAYITTSASFGPQTNLSNAVSPKIEFSNSVLRPAYGLNTKLAQPVTLRKEFVQSADGKLILLKRKLPSQKDGTTMTVGLRTGMKHVKTVGTETTITQCNAIVFNADGQAVCLVVDNQKVISGVKVASSYGNRLIYSTADMGGGDLQVKSNKQFSIKALQGGVVVNKKFDGHPVP